MIKHVFAGLASATFALVAHGATDYPSGYTKCVQVGGTCAMSGTRNTALGKAGSFVYATKTGSFACTNAAYPANSYPVSAWCSYGATTSASSSVASSSTSSRATSSTTSSTSSRASSSSSSSAASGGEWSLSGDIGTHDPTLIQEGSAWYEFHTGTGIQGKRSDDGGKNWYAIPQVFLNRLSWWETYVPDNKNNDVWAPDATLYNGRVWLYYSISTFGSNTSMIGLASASSVGAGSWRDDGLVLRTTSSNDYNAIDPNLTIDSSGNPWLTFGSFWSGIKLTKLDKATMKPTGSLYSLASRSAGVEAPTIIYRNGYYYLFVSIDKCCQKADSTYKIAYGRSSSITGPYVDKNGTAMTSGGGTLYEVGGSRWKGPGGQDIVGTSVIVRHAYDANDGGNPKLRIRDLKWDSSGWPVF